MPNAKANSGEFTFSAGKTLLSLFFISVAVFVCYANTLDNDFVHDDHVEILQNPLIKDSSGLTRILTSPAWSFLKDTGEPLGSNYYRPVQYLTYFSLFHFFGTAPLGYHLFKLLLHLGVCLLFFWIGYRFLVGFRGALASSLIFAVHPANTEAVSWISGITDTTCALFFLLSFYFFLSDEENPSAGRLVALQLCFLAGMFSKETMATFIPVLLIYQWLQGKLPSGRQAVRVHLPLVLILLMYLGMRVAAIGSFTSQDQVRYESLSWFQGILNQIVLLSQYFWTFLFPLNLTAHHVFDPALSLADLRFWFAVLMLAGILVSLAYAARNLDSRQRAIMSFGLLMFVVVLSPVLIFYRRIGENVFAERYLYLPAVGLALSLTTPLVWMKFNLNVQAAFFALLILLSWWTIRRNIIWENNLVFYETTAKASPGAAGIWNNLGTSYIRVGRIDDALRAFETSDGCRPNSDASGNLGRLYAFLKRFVDSESAYLKAIQLNPRRALNYSGLADLYFAQQRYKEAITLYKRTLEIRPDNVRVSFNLVDTYRMEKRFDEALAVCRQVAALGPQQAKSAYQTMGGIYAQQRAAEADRMSKSILLGQ
ncbi:MAG: tetratricopeptide repeat protein [Acidobacteria bacterium]|nr:tetratricopeptide repeat protein [Acidobacteriota bacterium]